VKVSAWPAGRVLSRRRYAREVPETSCPADLARAVPLRILERNGHLERLTPGKPVDAATLGLVWMRSHGLPLGPLAGAQAVFIRTTTGKTHGPRCVHGRRRELTETAPVADALVHEPCERCGGFDVEVPTGESWTYLWAVMLLGDLADRPEQVPSPDPDILRPFDEPANQVDLHQKLAEVHQHAHTVVRAADAVARAAPSLEEYCAVVRRRARNAEAAAEKWAATLEGMTDEELAARAARAGAPQPRSTPTAAPRRAGHDPVWARVETLTGIVDAGPAPEEFLERIGSRRWITALTHQRAEVWEQLRTGLTYRPDPARAEERWAVAYQWMQEQVASRVPGASGSTLVWLMAVHNVNTEALCDSSCGNGLPLCERLHAYPGFVYLLVQVPATRCLLSDWSSWDIAVAGAYVPAGPLDRDVFGEALLARYGSAEAVPPPQEWPADLLERAKASFTRVFVIKRHHLLGPEDAQAVCEYLRPSDVVAAVRGPDPDDTWFAAHLERHPDDAPTVARLRHDLEAYPPVPKKGGSST
jgi:hypothetical protein